MNGSVTITSVTVRNNMPTLSGQKKKRRSTLIRKSAKTKVVKQKHSENGFSDKAADVPKNEQQDVEKQENCAVCKMRGKHEMVDLQHNLQMRETLSKFLDVPLKSVKPTLANICVQCVLKININSEIALNLKNSISRPINGQASNATTESTQNFDDISTEKQRSTCIPKTPVQKKKKKISIQSSPTKSCSQSLKPQSATIEKPNPVSPDLTILQVNRQNTPEPTVTSPQAMILIPQTSPIIESCDVSPSPAYSPIKQRHSNESNTKSNVLPDTAQKSTPPEVIVRVKREKFPQHQNAIVNLSNKNSSISIHSSTPHTPYTPVPPPAVPISVPLLLESTKDVSIPDSDGQNQSMLEVYYERSESALITESGGKINRYETERLPSQKMICPTCRSLYLHKYYYARHVRRCSVNHPVTKGSHVDQPILNSAVEVVSAPSRAASRKRIFYCNQCPVTLDSMKKLRDHKHIHLQRFYCETCGKESMARQDHEFHIVTCLAKQLALNTSVVEQTQIKEPGKRMTRSMSRAASRPRTSRLSDEHTSEVTENIEDEEEDDEFEAASVADTMYTKRMRFTGHWLKEHSNSASNFSLNEHEDIPYDFDDEMLSDKEFDLYLLDKLKMQKHLHCLSCFIPGCDFHTENLVFLIAHEYIDHKMRLWFHCKKCRCGFTSKVHLDYHLACQNGGRFICYKCGDIFEFQHLLDRHLIRHTKCINHRCNYCSFEFLTENELLQHCDIEQHDANGARKLISIDTTMTIVNREKSASPIEDARSYHVRILDMKLPKMPTKRPRPMPGHLPYRLRIGEVLFEDQKNPNCWGWK